MLDSAEIIIRASVVRLHLQEIEDRRDRQRRLVVGKLVLKLPFVPVVDYSNSKSSGS